MTSKVLDLTTIGHALNELCDSFLGETEWNGLTDEQKQFLGWYKTHRDEIRKLDSLEAKASTDYTELNTFLMDRGFDPMFREFHGIGVASVLDMLVEWVAEATPTTLRRYQRGETKDVYGRRQNEWVPYPAFQIEDEGVDIYDAAGFTEPLVRLKTKTGHSLWLMKAEGPESGLELNDLTQKLLTYTDHRPARYYPGVIVPMLDLDLEADLAWLTGMEADSPTKKTWAVTQAFQKFKLRANEQGARVKVVTGMVVASAACAPIAEPYTFDEPFVGFFTQPGNDTLPLAAFWADTDVWRKPAGSLEEL